MNFVLDEPLVELIILLGISWSDETDFEDDKAQVELLNSITRAKFVPLE